MKRLSLKPDVAPTPSFLTLLLFILAIILGITLNGCSQPAELTLTSPDQLSNTTSLYYEGEDFDVDAKDAAIAFALAQGIQEPDQIINYVETVLEIDLEEADVLGRSQPPIDDSDFDGDGISGSIFDAAVLFSITQGAERAASIEIFCDQILGIPCPISEAATLPVSPTPQEEWVLSGPITLTGEEEQFRVSPLSELTIPPTPLLVINNDVLLQGIREGNNSIVYPIPFQSFSGSNTFSLTEGETATVTFSPNLPGDPSPIQVNITDSSANIIQTLERRAQVQPSSPNIILITTDDQRWDTIEFMETVQRELVDKGVIFTQAYTAIALCGPSRASVLSGQYSSSHGVLLNANIEGGITEFNENSTLGTWLDAAGYETAFLGKYLNGYNGPIPTGWDQWFAFLDPVPGRGSFFFNYTLDENGTPVSYGSSDSDYSTDVLANKAVDFIRTAPKPFFLLFAPYPPHEPATPAPRHDGTFDDLPPWRPPNFNEEDTSDKPGWVDSLPLLDPDEVDAYRVDQIESLQALDEAIAQIITVLEETDQINNTAIIFTSDQGHGWGEHRWFYKRCPYQECLRVPFIVRYPNLIETPFQTDDFAQNIDVAPTILALAEASADIPLDGINLTPVLEGNSSDRPNIFFEHWQRDGAGGLIPQHTAVITPTSKFIEYETGGREFYDLVNDPFELDNRINDPEYRDQAEALRDILLEFVSSQTFNRADLNGHQGID